MDDGWGSGLAGLPFHVDELVEGSVAGPATPPWVLYVEDNPMNGEMVSEYLEAFENIRTEVVHVAEMMGQTQKYRGFAEQCMAEYDLDGWTSDKFLNPADVSAIGKFNF